jgi:predicted dehydrogenase
VTSETGYYRNSKKGEWHYAVDPAVQPGEALDWKAWCGPLGEQPWDTLVYHQWRRYRKFSTGIVGDLLVHQMTPLMHTIDQGWPVRVVAVGAHHVDMKMENFDQVNLLVQFETGHTMTVSGSTCNANGPAPIIRGHKGSIHLSGNNCRFTPEKIWAEELDPDDSFKGGGDSHDKLRLDFLACCRERRTPLSTVDLGLKVMIVSLSAKAM